MQKIQNEYISKFQLTDIWVDSMVFHREKTEIGTLKFKFEPTYKIDKDIEVSLSGLISDENKKFNLQITLIARFVCDFGDITEDVKDELIKKNTLSIMFPYLRSQITLMTSQPNMQPIVIPAININAFIEAQNKN